MRTISFNKASHSTDPVNVGDILRIRRGNKCHTVIVVNEVEVASCEGCIFAGAIECSVPDVRGSLDTLCCNAGCVFKDLNKVMESL